MTSRLFARDALLPQGWARDVLIEWDLPGQASAGRIGVVRAGATCPPDAQVARGPVLPGMPNLHSHAFQRLFAGLTEWRSSAADSFWSWRELMYRCALAISPEELEAIATGLYVQMIEAGYTSVCEFHYLHNRPDGAAYADEAELSLRLAAAARAAGIGLTLLPVLYQQGGLPQGSGAAVPLAAEQRRFGRSTESLLRMIERLRSQIGPGQMGQEVQVGLAPHSLRAVTPAALAQAVAAMHAMAPAAPIHIHVAEQPREVEQCLAWSGRRPVDWLLDHVPVDSRWCLVDATHLSAEESARAAASEAVAGLCPSTEANLGDGIFAAPAWIGASGRWGIGSDSHATVSAADELALLEYSQRLATGRRNVMASEAIPETATAMWLSAVAGGAQASGRPVGGIAAGQSADFVELDATDPVADGCSAPQMLAVQIFSRPSPPYAGVWQAGRRLVADGRHAQRESALRGFADARRALLGRTSL